MTKTEYRILQLRNHRVFRIEKRVSLYDEGYKGPILTTLGFWELVCDEEVKFKPPVELASREAAQAYIHKLSVRDSEEGARERLEWDVVEQHVDR